MDTCAAGTTSTTGATTELQLQMTAAWNTTYTARRASESVSVSVSPAHVQRAPPPAPSASASASAPASASPQCTYQQQQQQQHQYQNQYAQYAHLVLARPPKRVLHLRKRRRMSALAEHFEYTHLPAHLSAIQNFHIRSLLSHRENLLIVQLQRHLFVECALIDMRLNKFRGVFGRQVLLSYSAY